MSIHLQNAPVTLGDYRFTARHAWLVLVCSMEQIIGAGLSTLAGIIIPMINLLLYSPLSPAMQGLAGAAGLTGIAIGSPIIGALSDKYGYLFYFRLCPLIIVAGSLIVFFTSTIWWTIAGLFIVGVGVGGGYSLDSAYLSDLMPNKWKSTMIGVAKASSALGFIGVALMCYIIVKVTDTAHIWPALSIIIATMGAITFLMRIKWAQSPLWCLNHNNSQGAQKAVDCFFNNKGVTYNPLVTETYHQVGYLSLFKGENLKKVIFSGIPWACEGVGVYGVGVFLPVLVMSLGIESSAVKGIFKIDDSIIITALINTFILVGFIVGLFMLNRFSHLKMLVNGFLLASAGLALVLAGYMMHLPAVVSLTGFLIFEFFLNVGPHLITFIIPPHIFAPEQRAAGNGIAAFLGKAGAIAGVFIMPWLLTIGGMTLVLGVCIGVNIIGASIGWIYGRKLYN